MIYEKRFGPPAFGNPVARWPPASKSLNRTLRKGSIIMHILHYKCNNIIKKLNIDEYVML